MKLLIVTAAALLLVLAAAMGVWLYLADSAEQVCGELSRVGEALWLEDWPGAEAAFYRTEAEWQQTQRRWAKLLDHKEMENIEIGLVDLKSAISRRERDEALKEEAELVFFLRHASEAERPCWENIF